MKASMGGQGLTIKLRAELVRLQPLDPFQVLGLERDAQGDAVRAAFLAATKRFHPNFFARESPEVLDLAHELFLIVRKAYDQLGDEAKRQSWRDKLSGKGTLRPAARPEPAPPPAKPATVPPAAKPRTVPPAAAKPKTVPPGATAKPATTPPSSRAPLVTPPPPMAKPAPPPPTAAPAFTPRAPLGRGSGAQGPSKPSSASAASLAANRPEVEALLEAARTRAPRLDEANRLLIRGRPTEAREILTQLVAEDPQSRRYRQRLHLAIGLEHQQARRYDDAVREIERAHMLDPTANDIAEALREARELRAGQRSGGGLFSKLFGR